MTHKIWLLTGVLTVLTTSLLSAQDPQWQLITPATTGIPGDQIHFAAFDNDGDLWVGARFPGWQDGGVAEFDGAAWTTYSNINSPMPSDFVNSIRFGDDGAVWIGTDGGLVRLLNDTWTIWDSSNTPLPYDEIFGLSLDDAGGVWMTYGLWGDGVAHFDGSSWTVWTLADIGYAPSIVLGGIYADVQGDIWVGTAYAGGVARLPLGTVGPGASWEILDQSTGHSDYPSGSFQNDPDGNLWAFWEVPQKFDGTTWTRYPVYPGNHQFSVLKVVSDGVYWLGAYDGSVGFYNGTSWSVYNYGYHVYSISIDDQGLIWIAGLADLQVWNPNNGAVLAGYNYTNTGLADYSTRTINFDNDGDAWFATTTAGLSEFDGTVWEGYSPYNWGSNPWPTTNNGAWGGLEVHPGGNVWLGMDLDGVLEWDGTSWTNYLKGNWVDTVGLDVAGGVWTGTVLGGGVARYDGSNWTNFNPPMYNELRQIVGAPNGDVFLCTRTGLIHFDGQAWTLYNSITAPIPTGNCNDVEVHPDGSWWVATTMGLLRFDGTAWTVYDESNSGIPADVCSHVEIGADGTVWVAGFNGQAWPNYGGVSSFDGTTWRLYNSSNSTIADEQIWALDLDPWGNLWVGTAMEGVALALTGTAPPFTSPWIPFGRGLIGSRGVPQLSGSGTLVAGTPATLSLTGALENAPTWLVIGLDNQALPFRGGVMIPSFDFVIPGRSDAVGERHLTSAWPTGLPAGYEVIFQSWVFDPAAPQGMASSAGLKARTP